jgi:peroxiredoxin (alkyl hydroperoxide reductase subunit C)
MGNLVGKKAPLFVAKAVQGDRIIEEFRLADVIGAAYVVLFFYPKDFTFVCPTELHAFQEKLPEFERRNVRPIACSTDSEFCHHAWLRTATNMGGIAGVTYPIVADHNKLIAEAYGVLAGECVEDEETGTFDVEGELVAQRGLFLIDRQGIVQHVTVNAMALGRNVDEVLRTVDALQFFEKNGEVCPANWHAGEAGLRPTEAGVAAYLSRR